MADRFPSIEDIDAGQVEATGNGDFDALQSSEPSDFLARERALLGDDANQFTSAGDSNVTVEGNDTDLLGGGGGAAFESSAPTGPEVGQFESNFPSLDTQNEAVAPGGSITGTTLPYVSAPSFDSEPEPDVIREWRERRDMQISHREEVAATKKVETIKAAHTAIDEFYENYNNKKEKSIAQTRREADEFLKSRQDTTSGGTSWDRIAKLVDLTGKGAAGGASGTSKAKFRELLVGLRKDEKAPGATGY